ncbi:MAG: hypothetical protein ACT4PM_13375 [Gemmatimonadales bacterium]
MGQADARWHAVRLSAKRWFITCPSEDTMHGRLFLSGSTLLVPMLLATQPADAQRVRADIRIGGGPISGRVVIGDRYRDYYRPRPRAFRVEVLRWRDHVHHRNWLRKFRRDSRVIVVYHDYRGGYYDRFRPGLVECRVYERGGRYYRWDNDRFDRWVYSGRFDDDYDSWDDRHDRWHDENDRYDRDDRYRDRYDRDDRRYDDRYRGRDDRGRRGW